MRALREHRRWSALPVLAWLVMQLAMVGGQSLAVRDTGRDSLAALFADGDAGFWICSASGPRLVEPGDPGDSGKAPVSAEHCYWCQGFGSAPAPTPPPAFALSDPTASGQGLAVRDTPERVRGLRVAAFRSRAPPLLRAV